LGHAGELLFDQLTAGFGLRLKGAGRKMDFRSTGECRDSHANGFLALEHLDLRGIADQLVVLEHQLLNGVPYNPGWNGYR